MSDVPRSALRDIIAKHGTDVCSDARRCEGLLKDRCGAYRREINILVNALEERVPLDLLAAGNSLPRELLLARLAKRLEEHLALTEDAANWAVESWALALGIASETEIRARESKRANAAKIDSKPEDKNITKEADVNNFPPQPAPNRQPQKQQPRANNPPPFAPKPVPPAASRASINPPPQAPAYPVPAGKTAPRRSPVQTIDPALNPRPKRRSWKIRGCSIGCFLLLVLLAVLVVGVPYAFQVMRETQQSSPPRLPPR